MTIDTEILSDKIMSNFDLASELGWTNIVHVEGSLLGTPPNLKAAANSRGQALVPNWTGNWSDCAPLILKYFLSIDRLYMFPMQRIVVSNDSCSRESLFSDIDCDDLILRELIVQCVTCTLRKNRKRDTNPINRT